MFKQNRLIYAKEHYDVPLVDTPLIREFEPTADPTTQSPEGLPADLAELLEKKEIQGFEITLKEVNRACSRVKQKMTGDIKTTMEPIIASLPPADQAQARLEMADMIGDIDKAIEIIRDEYSASLASVEQLYEFENKNVPLLNAEYLDAKAEISRHTLEALAEIGQTALVTPASLSDVEATSQAFSDLREYAEHQKRTEEAVITLMGIIAADPTMSTYGDNPIDKDELALVARYASNEDYFGNSDFAAADEPVRKAYVQRVVTEFIANLQIQENENKDDHFGADLLSDDMSAESVAWQFQDTPNAGDYEPTYSWHEKAVAAGTAAKRPLEDVDDALFGTKEGVKLGEIPTFKDWHAEMFQQENDLSETEAKQKLTEASTKITDFTEKTKSIEGKITAIAPEANLAPIRAISVALIADAATLKQAANAPIIYYTDYAELEQVITGSEKAMKTQLKNYRDALVATLDSRQAEIESFKGSNSEPEFIQKATEARVILINMGDEITLADDFANLETQTTAITELLTALDAALKERFETKKAKQLEKLNDTALNTLLTVTLKDVPGAAELEAKRQDLIQKVTDAETEAEVDSYAGKIDTLIQEVKDKELEYKKSTGTARAKGLREGGFASIPEDSDFKDGFSTRLDAIDTALQGSDITAINAALEDLAKLEEEIPAALGKLEKAGAGAGSRLRTDPAIDKTASGKLVVASPESGSAPEVDADPIDPASEDEQEEVDLTPDDSEVFNGENPKHIEGVIKAMLDAASKTSDQAHITAVLGVLAGSNGSDYVEATDGATIVLDSREPNIYKRLAKAAKEHGGIRIKGDIIAPAETRLSEGGHDDVARFDKQKKELEDARDDDADDDEGLGGIDNGNENPPRTREEIIRVIERARTCDIATILEAVFGDETEKEHGLDLRRIIKFFENKEWKNLRIGKSKTFLNGDLIITHTEADAFEIHFKNIPVPGVSERISIYVYASGNRLTFNIQIGGDASADSSTIVIETHDQVERHRGPVLELMEEDDLATRKAIKLRELRNSSGLKKRELENFLTFNYKDVRDYYTALNDGADLKGRQKAKIRRKSIETHFGDVSQFRGGSVGLPGSRESTHYTDAIYDLSGQVDAARGRGINFPNLSERNISEVVDILIQAEWADEHSLRLESGVYHTKQVRIEDGNGHFPPTNSLDYQFAYHVAG